MANLISNISFVNTYNGGLGYWGGYDQQISYDGTYITFETVPGVASWVGYSGPNLPPFINISGTLMSSGAQHVYLKNMATGSLNNIDPVVIGNLGLDAAPPGYPTSISADGHYVAYKMSGNYTTGQPMVGANVDQVYVADATASTPSVVGINTNSNGVAGDGDSRDGALSSTGRYVAFDSNATNLVAGDSNGQRDVFLKDTVSGTTQLVSVGNTGVLGNGTSFSPVVSSDGRYVLFETFATNLDSTGDNVYVKDMQTGALKGIAAAYIAYDAVSADMTSDGHYVAYARYLPSADGSSAIMEVYRYDTQTNTEALVSSGPNGVGNELSKSPSISDDGRFVAFQGYASNLVSNDTNGYIDDIFVKDMATGAVARLDISSSGVQANGASTNPRISGDGHYVVFGSAATNLISGDNNSNPDVFLSINPFWNSGTSGNDALSGTTGNDTIDGGAGTDTVTYSGSKSTYTVTKTANGYTVKDNVPTDGTNTLVNVERLQFADAKVALDISGNPNACFNTAGLADAGQVYRLYQAAFNRTPDKVGLAYWIGQADSSDPLTTIAAGFTGSVEFRNTYGSLTDHQFVDQIYLNVLHRQGESAGTAWWYSQLDTHTMTREQVLVGFSDSNENQAALIGVIQNGIDYTT